MGIVRACLIVLVGWAIAPSASAAASGQEPSQAQLARLGHSAHGAAFDEGPRQKPWKMKGIGRTHFPITTSHPEVQEWFDQGHTLLHSFWYEEAERAFRWVLKLEPDNAMAYWGLARSVGPASDRGKAFLREAVRRKDSVSQRERRYIEVWEEAFGPEASNSHQRLGDLLELIVLDYPEDLEAKALLLHATLYGSKRYANELLVRAMLQEDPKHPGAHHYRIHNWDGPQGAQALDSCEAYGRIAHESGHANHMPGHVYSGIGMFHEAAIWMDSATRVEKQYMQDRMAFPFNAWNYAHNLNYLSYLQSQLGMVELALQGARDLLAAPFDPKYNDPDRMEYTVFRQGMRALIRALTRFERWEEILRPGAIPWRDTVEDKVWKAYVEALAHLNTGDLLEVSDRLAELKSYGDDVKDTGVAPYHEIQQREVEGLLKVARGQVLEGIGVLSEAARIELERRKRANDPPTYPRIVYNVLGDIYLAQGSPELAAKAFAATLAAVPNDGFALLGLVKSHLALGQKEKATQYYAGLLHVWSEADPDFPWMAEARGLGLQAEPHDPSPRAQRSYRSETMARLGPNRWEPYPAPPLKALDSQRQVVTLEEYAGKNVVLIFYLGEECPHCMEQLVEVKKRIHEFEMNNAQMLAISGDTPEGIAASLRMGELPFRVLSDTDHENARRFLSYDDFEDMELHSTLFIDAEGKVRWARLGGEPFMDLDFLISEIERVNRESAGSSGGL